MAIATTTKKPADVSCDIFKKVITFNFADQRFIEIDASKIAFSLQEAALMHGLKQKLMDAAAIARNTTNGASATIEDKYQAILEVATRLRDPFGTWNKQREGAAATTGGLLTIALCELTGKGKDEIMVFLDGKTTEEKAALKKNQKIAVIIARITAERAAAALAKAKAEGESGIDTDDMLGELMGEGELGTDDERSEEEQAELDAMDADIDGEI